MWEEATSGVLEAAPRITSGKVPSPVLREEAAAGQFRMHGW